VFKEFELVGDGMSAKEPRACEEFYHVRVRPGEVAKYVLLPGDPERVPKLAKFWEDAYEVSYHREFRLWNGRVSGRPISACSTGIGAPSAAIAVEELARAGANTFIRVGSTGVIQPGVNIGDLVISKAAVRLEGTSLQYTLEGYPAYADYEVTLALIEAAESLSIKYHVGVTASTDSFYSGQSRPGYRNYWWSYSERLIKDLQAMGVLNLEMEASVIFTLASIYGLRAGAVCAVFANRVEDTFGLKGEEEVSRFAVEAVKILHEWDALKSQHGKRYVHPSLLRGWRR